VIVAEAKQTVPQPRQTKGSTMNDVEQYLTRFGYLASGRAALGPAVAAFRRLWGLPEGEEVDELVQRAMATPRCGLPDHPLTTAETRWRKTDLTVYVESYVTALSKSDQDDLIDQSLKVWPAVAGIAMRRVKAKAGASIVIGAARGRSAGFDGPSGVLAWAELPPGDDRQLRLMMDLDEVWRLDSTTAGILFYNVLNHELGHSIGLGHSEVRTALMAPYYAAGVAVPQADDDIPRARAIYGAPVVPPPVPPAGSSRIVLEFDGPVPTWRARAG
jgi:matrix metalloproteinase-14 (membrane-inserted)